jgi:3-carboxy-cis,cis-muconate cycloisomerase
MSFTPFNAPLLSGLLGDPEVVKHFSVGAELSAMTRVEAALAKAEAEVGVIGGDAAEAIAAACETFQPDIAAIGAATARDGVIVPEFIRQLRAHVGEPHANHVHFGSTSQDVIDTSFVLRVKDVIALLEKRLIDLIAALEELDTRFGANQMMARTRMQAAIPITVCDRLRSWKMPLDGHLARLAELKPRLLALQFGGAAGTLDKLGDKAGEVGELLARSLGLQLPDANWQTDRSAVAELAGWLSLVTGTLGKMGQDIALMAQTEIGEIRLSGSGGSSAMPHKQNPVKAEILVTLARFNAVQVSGVHQSLVHEQERSGAAWTLEWMLMPQMAVATGASLRSALQLIEETENIGKSE